jgi:hypothetical protein
MADRVVARRVRARRVRIDRAPCRICSAIANATALLTAASFTGSWSDQHRELASAGAALEWVHCHPDEAIKEVLARCVEQGAKVDSQHLAAAFRRSTRRTCEHVEALLAELYTRPGSGGVC